MAKLLEILDEASDIELAGLESRMNRDARGVVLLGPITFKALWQDALRGYPLLWEVPRHTVLYCGERYRVSEIEPEIMCEETERRLAEQELAHA